MHKKQLLVTLHHCKGVYILEERLICFSFQIKNDVEAEVLCMTAIGNIKLQQNKMEETKVLHINSSFIITVYISS